MTNSIYDRMFELRLQYDNDPDKIVRMLNAEFFLTVYWANGCYWFHNPANGRKIQIY